MRRPANTPSVLPARQAWNEISRDFFIYTRVYAAADKHPALAGVKSAAKALQAAMQRADDALCAIERRQAKVRSIHDAPARKRKP